MHNSSSMPHTDGVMIDMFSNPAGSDTSPTRPYTEASQRNADKRPSDRATLNLLGGYIIPLLSWHRKYLWATAGETRHIPTSALSPCAQF